MDSNPYFNDELFGFRQKQGLKRTIFSVWQLLLNSHLLVIINEIRTNLGIVGILVGVAIGLASII